MGFFAAGTTVAIDGQTFFVVSEVDATDSHSNLVEIKSSKTEQIVKHSAVLQIALNGSEHILGCKLDDSQTRLLSVKWFSAEEIQQDHEKSFTQAGQHVRYMLRKVSDFLKHNKSDAKHEEKMEQVVWKLTFDASNGKLPSFEIATDVEVLPAGHIAD
ncbi:unnamed protein product [Cladocopium goreaui]|uniref:Uncharacterized protein n=1 Tax=Cladocopium goreaui TaxID=2562237 RepID=A0A9P1CVN6_9DINO|nr:unnamed protein product [Cladocopium goreaui]